MRYDASQSEDTADYAKLQKNIGKFAKLVPFHLINGKRNTQVVR